MSLLGRTNSLRRNLLALMVASPFLALAVVRIFALDRFWPLYPFVAQTPQTTVVLLVFALISFLLLRARAAALVLLVAAVWLIVLIFPRTQANDQPVAHGRVVRIFSANLLGGGANAASLAHDIRAARPDIIALQEAGPEDLVELRQAGLLGTYRYSAGNPQFGTLGWVTLSRWPLQVDLSSGLIGSSWREMHVVGTPIEFRNVHPAPPVKPGAPTTHWLEAMAAIPPAAADAPRVRIVAGDFNATLDHRPFRAVLARGYHDAADQTGKGLDWTWHGNPILRMVIDHILVESNVRVLSYHVYPLQNSDHNAISATLQLP